MRAISAILQVPHFFARNCFCGSCAAVMPRKSFPIQAGLRLCCWDRNCNITEGDSLEEQFGKLIETLCLLTKNHQCSPCLAQSFVSCWTMKLGKSCNSWEAVLAECQALLVQVIGCGGTDKKRAGFDEWQPSTGLDSSVWWSKECKCQRWSKQQEEE